MSVVEVQMPRSHGTFEPGALIASQGRSVRQTGEPSPSPSPAFKHHLPAAQWPLGPCQLPLVRPTSPSLSRPRSSITCCLPRAALSTPAYRPSSR